MRRDDRGSIAPLVPIVMFVLLLLGGLLVDGSRVLNSKGNAQAYAEEAARAGASAILPTSASKLELDPVLAQARVAAYCRAIENTAHANVKVTYCNLTPDGARFTVGQGCRGDPDPNDIVVHTKVVVQIDSTLLGMAPGLSRFSSSAVASAQAYQGYSGASFYC